MSRLKEIKVHKFSVYFTQWRRQHVLPVIYTAFLSLGALYTFVSIFRSKSEAESAFFLGYSLEKMLLGTGLLFLFLLFIALTVKLSLQPELARHFWEVVFRARSASTILIWIVFAVFISCWVILFLPYYRLAGMSGYVSQLKDVIVWLAVVSAVTMLIILLENGKESIGSVILGNRHSVFAAIIVLLLFVLAGGIVTSTGIGIQHPGDYWYATGVPVLGLQILFALAIGIFLMRVEVVRGRSMLFLDVLICLGLWLVTAWLWGREPLRPNFFMPDTLDNLMYPYSDSATFDIGSQFALIGQGIFNGQYFDRALYISLLTYLHMAFGQNIDLMMTAQATLFAVFPMVIYLIGRELHSRALGISAAVLILLRGLNSLIASKWIDLASPKMILTDFATAIGVAIFMLLALKWLREPSKRHLALWAGGALGLTIMLRTHVLMLVPVLIFYLWIRLRPHWGYAAIGTVLLILGMLAATTPWDLRNRENGTPMFYVYYYRIQEVLRARYGVQKDTFIPETPLILADVQNSRFLGQVGNITRQRISSSLQPDVCDSFLCRITNHFFHNFITSFLFLPTSFVFDDLWNTIKLSTPYWKNNWLGEGLGLTKGIFLFINMALVSLGFGAMWARNRIVSLLPVSFFLTYIFSNALAFTSGGRYVVPVDWIICIYYIAGLLQIITWTLKWAGWHISSEILSFDLEPKFSLPQSSQRFSGIISAFVLVFAIGSLIPLAEKPFERRYPAASVDDTLAMLEQKGMFEQASFNRNDLGQFLSDPQADILVGRLLYPRYYPAGEGEMDRHHPYLPLKYERNVFIVIGPFGSGRQNVIIAGDPSEFLTQAADVVVVGCKNQKNMDGLIVFELSDPSHVYMRSPQPEWKCPLPEP